MFERLRASRDALWRNPSTTSRSLSFLRPVGLMGFGKSREERALPLPILRSVPLTYKKEARIDPRLLIFSNTSTRFRVLVIPSVCCLRLEGREIGLATHRHHAHLVRPVDRNDDLERALTLVNRDVANLRAADRQLEGRPLLRCGGI